MIGRARPLARKIQLRVTDKAGFSDLSRFHPEHHKVFNLEYRILFTHACNILYCTLMKSKIKATLYNYVLPYKMLRKVDGETKLREKRNQA